MTNLILLKRFCALIIDLTILTLAITGVYQLVLGFWKSVDINQYVVVFSITNLFIAVLYSTILELIFNRTLGKFIFKIKVVDYQDGRKVSITQIILRSLLKYLFPFGFVAYFTTKNKQMLHDILTKTKVVLK